jgi:hypothetical protein
MRDIRLTESRAGSSVPRFSVVNFKTLVSKCLQDMETQLVKDSKGQKDSREATIRMCSTIALNSNMDKNIF